ncbi:MAG: hypothetical protein F9K40_20250 [Kofleriaceae bacterium]|nr:MAG: hypothetical protein F9K40_20250 [Kofleriaceae bacterium]MBZ0233197.1 hypothetical protein [Kofleriaceae bacterium]
MSQRRVGTLFVLLSVAAFGSGGCSLVLDFDKPPVDAPPDSPVNDAACMAFEPNDSPDAAMTITAGEYQAAICGGGETDYFKVTMNGSDMLTARISFDNRNGAGDLDIRLLNATGGSTIDESRTSANEETVNCPGGIMCNGPLPAADYLIHVLGFNAAVQAEYTLTLEISAVAVDAGVDAP